MRDHFFYVCLYDDDASQQVSDLGSCGVSLKGIDDILVAYGIPRILSDVDAKRDFRSHETIVGSVLEFVTHEGFYQTFRRHGLDKFRTAQMYRDRDLLYALGALK